MSSNSSRPRRAAGAALGALATAALLAACGGGGSDASGGSAAPGTPQQNTGSVPESATQTMAGFMQFWAAWASDENAEALELGPARQAPEEAGDAWPTSG